jgi:curved DNA-binding protein
MSLEYKDYYAILGVSRRASDETIKREFRRLARKFHPDVARDKKAAEDRFKEINEAYEVLGNPENRRKYDRLSSDWKERATSRPPHAGARRSASHNGRSSGRDFEFRFGGTGFSEFFETLFGRRSQEGSPLRHDLPETEAGRGGDLESDILVALDEVLHGSIRTITQQRIDPEDGHVDRSSFSVRIPPAVRDGQLIRVPGRGEQRPRGQPGDLYLRVRLAQHPDFRVRERDLIAETPIAPWEAVLGATISVPTLEGSVSLRLPAGSRNGQHLRLRGRGLPAPDGSRGDLYVVIQIEVPSTISDEERALWQQLASRSRFRPRSEH